jgi:hypothetical protein
MDISKELFDEFIQWLIRDGLTPKKSERLWRKTIYSRLLNGHKNTKENWEDFMVDFHRYQTPKQEFDENCLSGIGVNVSGVHKTISNVVKGETMSRIFFEDGANMDVKNNDLLQILKDHQATQK